MYPGKLSSKPKLRSVRNKSETDTNRLWVGAIKKDASARVEPVASKMPDLASNVVLKARRMLILRCAHPTYHYGDDRLWIYDFRGYILTTISRRRDGDNGALNRSCTAWKAGRLAEFSAAHGESIPGGICFRPS